MDVTDYIPTDPQETVWDVVVIGTGAGGATAGLDLARLGRSVLFLERGKLWEQTGSVAREPSFVHSTGTVVSACKPYGLRQGPYENTRTPEMSMVTGIGGSTSLFAMVMDRFRPIDFTPHRFAHLSPSTSLPDVWPIQYEDLEPYYREAEALFRVRGTEDPLTSRPGELLEPPAPSHTETVIHDTLRENGLHPYRLHYARENVSECDGCPMRLCDRGCRNDAGRICVRPALEQHGAAILPNCLAVKLEASGRVVREVICLWNGRYVTIRGRIFVLALNALFTPALLLRSTTELFPDGLGNRSGMVGRNLMSHVSDWLSVRFKSPRGVLNEQLHHGLSINDFYVRDGVKLGNIHAHAIDFTSFMSKLGPVDESTGTVFFNTIVEDFPYVENRVIPKPATESEVFWEYRYADELRFRNQMLLDTFAGSLRPECDVSICGSSGILNGSHGCGTCRFGEDPRSSVLDRENRVHDLDNTYVVDASFFPSSGGINPSLTIVANSLRVSRLIAAR